MIDIRKSQDRGKANFAWLDSKHTFSFGHYYDPEHMGFSALRVINDDTVAPGAGFDTHGHRDMEIISYVLAGSIKHKDSEGNIEVLPAGEFQLMSAGSGVYHSEYNASQTEPLKFLQIWIQPNATGGKPGYQQKQFSKTPGITTIVSPDGANGSLEIKQNATLQQLILEPNSELDFDSEFKNVYVHLVSGELEIGANNESKASLTHGDGAKITQPDMAAPLALRFKATGKESVMALIFELPL